MAGGRLCGTGEIVAGIRRACCAAWAASFAPTQFPTRQGARDCNCGEYGAEGKGGVLGMRALWEGQKIASVATKTEDKSDKGAGPVDYDLRG